MGNFKKEPIKTYKYNNTIVREYSHSRWSDKFSLCGLFLLLCLWIYIFIFWMSAEAKKDGICKSDECFARMERLYECKKLHIDKKDVVTCATLYTVVERKSDKKFITKFFRKTREDIENLYELEFTRTIVKNDFDIDRLAYAVAMAETWNCKYWYGKTHNNCFWIKHWNTAPCPWVPKGKMCKFKSKEASYEAFKKIWEKWYKKYPDRQLASRWTWADRVDTWLEHVNLYFK